MGVALEEVDAVCERDRERLPRMGFHYAVEHGGFCADACGQTQRDTVALRLVPKIPHGDGQTILREALLIADHNAYHLGALAVMARIVKAAP